MHALTENIREEVSATGVRLVIVAPGVVETGLLDHTTDEDIKAGYRQWKADGLKSKPLLSEDVARVCLFAFQQPAHVCLREIVIGPTFQAM